MNTVRKVRRCQICNQKP